MSATPSMASIMAAFRGQTGPDAAAAMMAALHAAHPGAAAMASAAAAAAHPPAIHHAMSHAAAARAAEAAAARVAAQAKKDRAEKEEAEARKDDGHEVSEDISYTPYRPQKLRYGRDHPDPVVENATLAACAPPDITYNLALPASIVDGGKLSNLQLEAVVYGCQRHATDLPRPLVFEKENVSPPGGGNAGDADGSDAKKPGAAQKREPPAVRAGFLLGDGAGMGKGRTLAGFVAENLARGRRKHVWISVSADLYQDAKRDLRDLGMGAYADKHCYNLGKLPYGSLVGGGGAAAGATTKKKRGKRGGRKPKGKTVKGNYDEGVMFATYNTLIGKSKGSTRIDQLMECE